MNSDFFHVGEEVGATEPYHYRGCGLEGIYLLNGYTVEEYDGESFVFIQDLEGLHQTIGRHLINHRKSLAPNEVRFLRKTMDLTQEELAGKLEVSAQTVARWEKGSTAIPGAPEKLLRILFHAAFMTDSELAEFRDFLLKKLDELDQVIPDPAQFELLDHWSEKRAA